MKPATIRKPTGRCAVCNRYRGLTDAGLLKVHKPHGVLCDGSLKPPRAPNPRPHDAWRAARCATFERDGHRCRKCGSPSGLEAHHIKERGDGGGDAIENLVTLCALCHDEWTWCEPATVLFEVWLSIPPARILVALWQMDWPSDVTARDFKEQIRALVRLASCAR